MTTGWQQTRHAPRSSHAVMYALNHFAAVVGDEANAAGGLCRPLGNDGGVVVFGITGDHGTSCPRAVAAAAGIERALERLNPRLAQEVGFIAEYALAIHAGPATIGHVGHGSDRLQTAVGETVLAAAVMRDHAAACGARFAISRQAATLSGLAEAANACEAIGVPHSAVLLEFMEHRRVMEWPAPAS